jgi:hypothetical protein
MAELMVAGYAVSTMVPPGRPVVLKPGIDVDVYLVRQDPTKPLEGNPRYVVSLATSLMERESVPEMPRGGGGSSSGAEGEEEEEEGEYVTVFELDPPDPRTGGIRSLIRSILRKQLIIDGLEKCLATAEYSRARPPLYLQRLQQSALQQLAIEDTFAPGLFELLQGSEAGLESGMERRHRLNQEEQMEFLEKVAMLKEAGRDQFRRQYYYYYGDQLDGLADGVGELDEAGTEADVEGRGRGVLGAHPDDLRAEREQFGD